MLKRTRISIAISAAFGASVAGYLPVAMAQQPQALERVEITGSSIKRIEAETGLPVQIITREDIQKTGAANVEQLMQSISANSSSGSLVAASSSGATTLGLSAVSLRGLSSQRTLVLVNGRRVSPYGYGFTNDSVSVDVNSIPIAAIDRVEILKDGASAVYGSDAIAGVVNFILRRDFQGLEASAEYGAARHESGAIGRASLAYGFGDLAKDRFNVLAVLSFAKEKALFGRDRKFASSGINVDTFNDTTSGNTFPANFVAADGSFGTRNPSFPTCPGPYATRSPLFDLIGSRGCRFDPSPLVSLIPDAERVGIFTSAKFEVSPRLQLFGEASFSRNEQNVRIQPTPISDQFTIPLNNPLANQFPYNAFVGGERLPPGQTSPIPYSTILLTTANPNYPTAFVQSLTGGATPDLLVRWRAAALGDRDTTDTSEATRLVFGARGLLGKWDYETALLYSASDVTQTVNDGFAYYSRILPVLNDPAVGVNFFGPNSPAAQAAIEATEFRGDALKTKTSLISLGGKASSDIAEMASGRLAAAVGGELRRENYELDPSVALQQGDLTGYGGNFAPVDRSRNVGALFAEVAVPVLRTLELNGAVRFDHYEAVGSSTNPKVGLRWQPLREVLVRASAGKGFRAPSLLDLHAPRTTGVSPPGLNDPLRCPTTGSSLDCATQFPVTFGGNPGLKPEKSRNLTAGIVLEPTTNVSLALDYFNIDLEDTISQGIPAATILSDLGRYGSLVRRGPPQGALPGPIVDIDQTNLTLGETKLAGVDVDLRMASPATAYGRFSFGLNGTYLSKYDTQNPDGSFSSALDTANNSTGGVIVRWRHYATVGWSGGNLSVTLAQSFQKKYNDLPGTFEDPSDPAFVPRKVGSYEIYHLHIVYTGIKNTTIGFGVKNLFDKDPPYTNAGGQTSFQAGYDPTYVDPRGRFTYARVTYRFL
jgi:iron complex outermembrane receptor protein